MNQSYSHIKVVPRIEELSFASSEEITFATPSAYLTNKAQVDQKVMSRLSGQIPPPSFASTVRHAETNAAFRYGGTISTSAPLTSTSTFPKLKLSIHKPRTGPEKAQDTRTVMYDPVQGPTPPSGFQSFHQSPPTLDIPSTQPRTPFYPIWSSDNELIASSEPPSWEKRPIQTVDRYHLASDGKGKAVVTRLPPSQHGACTNSSDIFSQTEGFHQQHPMRELSLMDAKAWWTFDYRIPAHENIMDYLDTIAKATPQTLQTVEERRMRQQNHTLFAPLFANLEEYLQPTHQQLGQFGSWAPCPEWSIDSSSAGLRSFFGEDWGVPPPRVGRDPRYRDLDGGRGQFEETWTRLGKDRRARW